MAEINSNESGAKGKHSGGPRQKKKSTRIDMTAMVDVAFLLLTFFILTTTLATPQAMSLVKPPLSDEGGYKPVAQSKVLTFILGADDKVHYFTGIGEKEVLTTDYSTTGLRQVVVSHLNKYPNRCSGSKSVPGCWDPIVVIKPHRNSKFKNMVDALDEMRIAEVPKYALDEVTAADSLFMLDHNLQ